MKNKIYERLWLYLNVECEGKHESVREFEKVVEIVSDKLGELVNVANLARIEEEIAAGKDISWQEVVFLQANHGLILTFFNDDIDFCEAAGIPESVYNENR